MTADSRFSSVLFDPEATAAAEQIRALCGGAPFALVVLGSGLADALNDHWGEPSASQPLGALPGVSAPVADG
ncbi:MAG: purine-nucleoside phosphorylase, partial [Actinomyces sp.]|nr:purine-nucleoside phosphorylase [Actinomyces sp.]